MKAPFYITTPIYYVNSAPHIGHAYTTIVADTITRFRALMGQDTYFLTGTDEHGQKIAESAKAQGCHPQEFVDRMSGQFEALWPQLHIQHDQFIRTTDPKHKSVVQQILQNIYDAGEIYLKEYEGQYCVGCERFLDDSDLEDGKCKDHQVPPVVRQEENYFFRMSKYQDWLLETLETQEDLIYPPRYRNEVTQFLKEPLHDLCISRPKDRLTWGIELPFDSNFVTYVWFDALLNYVSALGWPDASDYERYWPAAHQLIGKDILKTHAVYWPCMLKAAGIPLFQKLVVHGHWVSSGSKMSKSLGNVVDPLDMIEHVGKGPVRYFLLRDMSFGEDSNFTQELLISRYNGDLANNLGNLINRSINMSRKNFENAVPPCGPVTDLEKQLCQVFEEGIQIIKEHLDQFHLHRALEHTMKMADAVNKYIDDTTPWKLAKDPEQKDYLGTVLYHSLDAVRVLTELLSPVMPEKMEEAKQALGLGETTPQYENLELGKLQSGQALPKPQPIFPRIQFKPEEKTMEATQAPEKAKEATPPEAAETPAVPAITIQEFDKVELRVGTILESQKVEKADKLLHSQVDLGEEKPRSIVSGIAQFYDPATLPGKKVIVVSNLKPAKLRGILSEGMILCTDDGENLNLVEAPDVPAGTQIR